MANDRWWTELLATARLVGLPKMLLEHAQIISVAPEAARLDICLPHALENYASSTGIDTIRAKILEATGVDVGISVQYGEPDQTSAAVAQADRLRLLQSKMRVVMGDSVLGELLEHFDAKIVIESVASLPTEGPP